MSPRADASFFDRKREWSKRKDVLLGYYLHPYLDKVRRIGKPILIVDGFAGPGKFMDGEQGSPLIIARLVSECLARSRGSPISLLCIERDPELCQELTSNLAAFSFAEVRCSPFLNAIDDIEARASTHSVFLYVDPFAIAGLEWRALDRIFRFVQQGNSVEVLLNLNGRALGRTARLASGRVAPDDDAALFDASNPAEATPILIDAVVGGQWWRDIVNGSNDFAWEVNRLVEGFSQRLAVRFSEVCRHDIKEEWQHSIPKYTMLFASRHPDAVKLMNDAAVRSRQQWAISTAPCDAPLFETRPTEVVPDPVQSRPVILSHVMEWTRRGDLKLRVMRERFGLWSESEIRSQIEQMLRERVLESASGKTRINDEVAVRRCQPSP